MEKYYFSCYMNINKWKKEAVELKDVDFRSAG